MSATSGVFLEAGDFALGRCPECRREVLTYPDDEGDGAPGVRRCLHCDERLTGELRWVDVGDLEELGYVVDAGEDTGGGCATCATGCVVRPGGSRRPG
jgi:hypothetical protein